MQIGDCVAQAGGVLGGYEDGDVEDFALMVFVRSLVLLVRGEVLVGYLLRASFGRLRRWRRLDWALLEGRTGGFDRRTDTLSNSQMAGRNFSWRSQILCVCERVRFM